MAAPTRTRIARRVSRRSSLQTCRRWHWTVLFQSTARPSDAAGRQGNSDDLFYSLARNPKHASPPSRLAICSSRASFISYPPALLSQKSCDMPWARIKPLLVRNMVLRPSWSISPPGSQWEVGRTSNNTVLIYQNTRGHPHFKGGHVSDHRQVQWTPSRQIHGEKRRQGMTRFVAGSPRGEK